ncbi:MAG: hypothetical protein U5K79_11165 [Cyclobacteriaceae bacterium]|nr:hypothetical protein [Cyclobacteriaceae bacterium]
MDLQKEAVIECNTADERNWDKWNGNPYYADGGGDGREEDDGASCVAYGWGTMDLSWDDRRTCCSGN